MSDYKVNRRKALMAFGLMGAAPAVSGSGQAPVKGAHFVHGVAAGDPLHDRLVLWTRVSGLEAHTEVEWQIATDAAFSQNLRTGKFLTDAGRDYTVKVDVAALSPDRLYFYRFVCAGVTSPVGQAKTLPLDTDRVVLAVASCSLYSNGYFNAYRAIADMSEVDAVLHLGDYIYEYGAGLSDYGMGNGRLLGRIPEPPHEIVTLADYRTRHAQYKADTDLQAAHARAAWICVFDDHEICNDPWMAGAENHQPDREGDFMVRKAVALKAYREWMPIREPQPGQLSEAAYRSFRFGKLAEFFMTETRLLARSKQLDYRADLTRDAAGQVDYDAFRKRLNDPARELLGEAQRQWLQSGLKASVADGVRWQVLGNQVVMARVAGPNLKAIYGEERIAGMLKMLPPHVAAVIGPMIELFSQTRDPLPLNLDAWDGYPAERERFYAMVRAAGARAVVLSGDSHQAWANELHDASGVRVAVEMGVTAISSPTIWFDHLLPNFSLARVLAEQNAEVLASSTDRNGFVRLTLTPETMIGEWVSVSTITARDYKVSVDGRFEAHAEASGVGPLKVVSVA
ncbi:MAG: alkaline phosphatase D family protein [Asticcacaulis sp.]